MARRKLCASTTFEILPLSLVHWGSKILYLQRYSNDLRNLCLSSKMLRGGIWVESSGAQVFHFCNCKAKTLRIDTFEILPLTTCTLRQQKSYTTKSIQLIFEIFAWARRCWGWALGGKFQVRRYFTFAMARRKLCESTTFEILPLSTCTLRQQILYLQRYSNDLRNLCLSSKMLRGGIWVESFRCAGVLLLQWQGENFGHRQHLKFATFNLFNVPAKSHISKSIQPIFEIFASARRCWGWAFGWKVLRARVVYFCNGNVKTLGIEKIWIFDTFDLFTVPAKIPYLQRYSIDFRNLCLSFENLRVGICVESFRCAGILLLQWKGENFAHRQHLKFCRFQPVQCALCQRKSYISNGIQPIFEIFASARRCWGWAFGWKSLSAQGFYLCNARWKLCASTTFEILPFSTCTLCQKKSYISKSVQPIFKIFASARRCWWWAFGWKVLGAQVVYFCNGKAKTLRIDNIWNFATFTCTLRQQNPISPKVFKRSSKSLPELEDVERGHLGGKFRCAGISLLQLQGENFAHRHIWNFATNNLYTAAAKILHHQKYSTDFRNLRLSSKMLRVGFGWKVSGAEVFYFCNGKAKTLRIDNIWNFATFNLYTQAANSISPKVFKRSSKSLPELEDVERGHLGGKFQVRRCFTFAMARWKLWASTTFEICHFQPVQCASKIPYLQKYSTDFRNLCLSSKMLRVGIWVESVTCAGSLLLQWQCENFGHRKDLNFWHFRPVHCASKNPISPKVFNRFSKSLPQLRKS